MPNATPASMFPRFHAVSFEGSKQCGLENVVDKCNSVEPLSLSSMFHVFLSHSILRALSSVAWWTRWTLFPICLQFHAVGFWGHQAVWPGGRGEQVLLTCPHYLHAVGFWGHQAVWPGGRGEQVVSRESLNLSAPRPLDDTAALGLPRLAKGEWSTHLAA